MKYSTASLFSLSIAAAVAAPTSPDYAAPPGGWESISYPDGTGENLPYYPAPPGGWESVDYGSSPSCPAGPISFTSTYRIAGVPEEVVNGTEGQPTGGLAGCTGTYAIGINSALDIICWHITLVGFRGAYSSPADTATHIHAGARGRTGPPRVVFPDPEPVGDGDERVSLGCKRGPFVTGVVTDGKDAGDGFTLKMLEDDPRAFYVDVHSDQAVPGANRGQFA